MDLSPQRDLNPSARTEQQVHQVLHQPQLITSPQLPRGASLALPNENEDEITGWLKEPSPATYNGARPAAGLRLLCKEQKTSIKWPFDKATFSAIQESLGLPATYSYLNMPKSGSCGKYLGIPGQPILKYDSTTNITSGYALLGPRISLETLCTQIRSQFAQFAHPLLVPTVLIELTATDLMRELYHVNRLLTASEYKTRSGD
ncbi:hypothetical protein EDB80DRAFT_889168 [Ilyonectria destructans]|nr:hypothetical protein EDB80DRAFT_889168 [Ilyonectria destructans]